MLSMIINDRQDGWDEQHFLHVQAAYSDSVGAVIALAPNEVRCSRMIRLPINIMRAHIRSNT